eukprot:3774975-Prymnesium_polylepis.2
MAPTYTVDAGDGREGAQQVPRRGDRAALEGDLRVRRHVREPVRPGGPLECACACGMCMCMCMCVCVCMLHVACACAYACGCGCAYACAWGVCSCLGRVGTFELRVLGCTVACGTVPGPLCGTGQARRANASLCFSFGQIVLRQMFEAADKDGNGTLDKEEVRRPPGFAALLPLAAWSPHCRRVPAALPQRCHCNPARVATTLLEYCRAAAALPPCRHPPPRCYRVPPSLPAATLGSVTRCTHSAALSYEP